jgi:hypothetical protein
MQFTAQERALIPTACLQHPWTPPDPRAASSLALLDPAAPPVWRPLLHSTAQSTAHDCLNQPQQQLNNVMTLTAADMSSEIL